MAKFAKKSVLILLVLGIIFTTLFTSCTSKQSVDDQFKSDYKKALEARWDLLNNAYYSVLVPSTYAQFVNAELNVLKD